MLTTLDDWKEEYAALKPQLCDKCKKELVCLNCNLEEEDEDSQT